jgi:hypothetical protein
MSFWCRIGASSIAPCDSVYFSDRSENFVRYMLNFVFVAFCIFMRLKRVAPEESVYPAEVREPNWKCFFVFNSRVTHAGIRALHNRPELLRTQAQPQCGEAREEIDSRPSLIRAPPGTSGLPRWRSVDMPAVRRCSKCPSAS